MIRGDVGIDDALAALDRDVDGILEKRRWMLDRAEADAARIARAAARAARPVAAKRS